ncbi:MAG: hypothetical protein RI973_327 [Bacteroidota bacterium]|jgi:hypothetical protein
MKRFSYLLFLLFPLLGYAQDERLVYKDSVYLSHIKSVKFHVSGLLVSMPILEMGKSGSLLLSFDDLQGDPSSYSYSIEHCNANWQPSGLTEFEYLDGFSNQRIETFEYSFKAKSNYTHFRLLLPNEDLRMTKSGNYLLKVYEDSRPKRLAITRRFMIADPKVKILPQVIRPAVVSKTNTHQEIDFTVYNERFEIRNPRQELNAVILQNGRWDSALSGISPLFSRPEEQRFDYQDRIVFDAGKEFRYLDLRGLRFPAPGIETVQFNNNKYEVWVEKDQKRGNAPHFESYDLNGNFIIENSDESDRLYVEQIAADPENLNTSIDALDLAEMDVHDMQSEYINTFFTLYSPTRYEEEDVYIFGGLTDWQFKEEFRMTYNPAVSSYVAKIDLKQGYYDYLYAVVSKKDGSADFSVTEGSWYETDNNYTILIYFRPFGGRYDQLIGVRTFSSRFTGAK